MRGKFWGLKAPKLSESEIELTILHFLVHQLRLFAWKNPSAGYYDPRIKKFRRHTNPYAIRGTPDIYCLLRGHLIGFEVKSASGKQTPDQKLFEEKAKAAGASYFVVRSLKEAEAAVRSVVDEFENAE